MFSHNFILFYLFLQVAPTDTAATYPTEVSNTILTRYLSPCSAVTSITSYTGALILQPPSATAAAAIAAAAAPPTLHRPLS